MKNAMRFLLVGALLLVGIVLVQGASAAGLSGLSGNFIIGPLCPNPPCNVPPPYGEYHILVYKNNELIRTLSINADGIYKTRLEPGIYTVDMTPNPWNVQCEPGEICAPPDGGANVPEEVQIYPGQTTIFDVVVDTGIR